MTESRQRQRGRARAKAEHRPGPEKIKATEAQKLLGCSKVKLAKLLRNGQLAYERDPLDDRLKLVKRADVEELLRRRGRS
jgi:hypothetical protein